MEIFFQSWVRQLIKDLSILFLRLWQPHTIDNIKLKVVEVVHFYCKNQAVNVHSIAHMHLLPCTQKVSTTITIIAMATTFIMLIIDVYGGKLSNLLHSERRGNSIMRTSVEFIEQGKRGASLPRSMKLIFSITSFIFILYMKRSFFLTLFDPGVGADLPPFKKKYPF